MVQGASRTMPQPTRMLWLSALAKALLLLLPGRAASQGVPPAANDTSKVRPEDAYEGLPLSFEPNEGHTDRRVRSLSLSAGKALVLAFTEAVLVL
jgi:hypothetical protein